MDLEELSAFLKVVDAGSLDEFRGHDLLSWQAPDENARVWPTLQGAKFAVEPSLIATDIHFLRHCCIEGLGIALLPDVMIPDPGLLNDALVPVLPDIVGKECVMRMSVPKALAEVPKVNAVLEKVQLFLQTL